MHIKIRDIIIRTSSAFVFNETQTMTNLNFAVTFSSSNAHPDFKMHYRYFYCNQIDQNVTCPLEYQVKQCLH